MEVAQKIYIMTNCMKKSRAEQEPGTQHTVRMKKKIKLMEKKKNQVITVIIHCSKEN